MEREIIDLPCSLFAPIMRDWHIDPRGRSAGDGVTGDGQVVYATRAKWVGKLDFALRGRDRVLVWGAIIARMRGRVNLLRLCLCAPYRPLPRDVLGLDYHSIYPDGIPHDDGAFFDDGSGYEYEPTASILGAAAAGATSLLINGSEIDDLLEPGHWFSINDWLYRCTSIDGSGSTTTITFEPPLREAVTTSDELNLNAHTIMAFETDSEGRAALEAGKWGGASLSLVEWTNRP